ncbi:pentatricopeptide repeat-containing protein At1g30610, chloroplastic [Andrographis paniculata]|uniref:pentatricopeptide repeat-containing protein At1g30610, chloroplastic n=1 Tax=Andrographis paniculata TaxID=175694 RepID=UPI0021E7DBDD|nr:pentatricopeptide repeat-containing protein At1g30610, chloroplastic [Andrographis paniculata]
MEAIPLLNSTPHSLSFRGSPFLRKPVVVFDSRRKRPSRIVVRSALSDCVLEEEFKFKPSFDEYLKALESVKLDRGSNDNDNDNRYNVSHRKRKNIAKKVVQEERKARDVTTAVKKTLEKKGFSEKHELVQENSRNEGFGEGIELEKVKRHIKASKVNSRSEIIDVERAAFKPLYTEDGLMGKPRISRVDMEERIQKLAKCLNGADVDMPEWKFTKMMRSAQIRYSDYSIMRVVQILGKLGNWRRVLQVIEWMQSRERYKSLKPRHIYTAALDALGKARRPVEALNLFRRMQEQLASYPDMVAYHCIAVTLGQAGRMKELFDVIDTMRSPPKKKFKTDLIGKWDPRLEPDGIVYNAVLNACVQCKKWEGAFWVLQQLSEQGQQPSCTTYGLVMEVMLACGKYNLVHDFFRKVQKSHPPNALIYRVLVNTLWKEGKTDEAIMAIEQMERRGIVGNAALYYDLARCLCSAGRCHDALEQIQKICKVASKPLVVTYTGLIQACLDSGDIKSGAYIFNHMKTFCSPNLVTYNIMLKAFINHKMFEEAKQLFMTLLENAGFIGQNEDYKLRVIPDIYTFNTMLDVCAEEQKWDDLEFVYERMLHYGHHFNAKRHLRLLLDAQRAGKEALLEMTWKHLIKTERDPPLLLTREMVAVKLQNGDYAAALSYIISFASPDTQLFSRKSWSNFFFANASRFDARTLHSLVHETSILLSENRNLLLEHLLGSCKEFLRTQRCTYLELS